MKKEILFPGLALLGGAAGFGLRHWQLSAAVDPQSGIIRFSHPATLGLVLLTALMVLAFLLLSQKAACPEELPTVFYCPDPLYMALMAAAGLLLLAAGGLGLMQTLSSYQSLRVSLPPEGIVSFPVMEVLCSALCLPAGASALVFGRYNYRGLSSPGYPLSSLAPGYLALLLLIGYYVDHSNDPLLLRYAWSLLGWVTTLLALYRIAGCCYRKAVPKSTLFFCGAAVYFQLVSLAGRPERGQLICTAALVLYLTAQSAALAHNGFGAPRMPSGAQENGTKIDE